MSRYFSLQCAAGVLVLALSTPIAAQVPDNRIEGRAVAADRFAPNRFSHSILGVKGARSLPHLQLNSAITLGYLSGPVDNYITPETDHIRIGSLVGRRYGGELSSTLGILGDAEAGLTLPFVVRQFRATGADVAYGELESTALGDPVLHGKYTFLSGEPWAAAVLASLSVPVGSGDAYVGRDGFGGQIGVALSYRIGTAVLAANLDYVAQPRVENISVPSDDELQLRGGVAYDIPQTPVGLDVAAIHFTAVDSPWGEIRGATGTELFGALRYAIDSRFSATAGMGVSTSAGFGVPEWRVFAGVRATGFDLDSPADSPESGPIEIEHSLEVAPDATQGEESSELDAAPRSEGAPEPKNEPHPVVEKVALAEAPAAVKLTAA
ncbi:MAG: hypothetical protein AAFQ82_21595, partial [Myxococcota bacterium]